MLLKKIDKKSSVHHIPYDIKSVATSGASHWKQWVQEWKASYVRKTGNWAAHVMAQNAKLITDCVVWVEDTPPMIQCQVHRDVLLMNQCSN